MTEDSPAVSTANKDADIQVAISNFLTAHSGKHRKAVKRLEKLDCFGNVH